MKNALFKNLLSRLPLKRRTIMSELMVAFVIVIFISSATIGILYFNTMNSYVKEKVIAYNFEIVKQAGQKLDFLLENIEISKRQLIGIAANQDIFSGNSTSPFVRSVDEDLRNVRRSNPSISEIYILGYNGQFYTSSSSFIKDRLLEKDWIKDLQNSDKDNITVPTHNSDYQAHNSSGRRVISFMKKVTDIDDAVTEIGIIQIDMDYSKIERIIESIDTDEQSLFFITDSNDRIIYFPDEKYLGKNINEVYFDGLLIEDLIRNSNSNKEDFVVKYTLQNAPWRILGVVPLNSVFKQFNTVSIIAVYIIFFTILVSLLIAYTFSKRITKPIQMLIKSMKNVGEGNFSATETITKNTDLQMLSSSFNTMIDKVNTLMARIIKKESESANAKFIALQAQINPHFLYNTLETIRSIAFRNNINSIADISKAMATVFRYSIDGTRDVVTLREELTHVRNYISIQKHRYGNKFNVEYDIDENLLDCEIIKLILQPLVENAIYHGIELKKKKSRILILCKESKTGIEVIIDDDGLGMPSESVAYLNENMNNYDEIPDKKNNVNFGIGLLNVNARIKLYYGHEYGLNIESELNKGTRVIVRIPARKKLPVSV